MRLARRGGEADQGARLDRAHKGAARFADAQPERFEKGFMSHTYIT